MPKYSAAADQAAESAELDPHAFQQIKNPRNLTLLLFLQNVADIIAREGSDLGRNFARNAAKGLKAHPSRVYDVATLKKVKGCGGAVAGMVQDNLWSKYPPEPADPEDLRFEQLEQEEALQGKARAKEANRKRKAQEQALKLQQCRQDMADGAGPDPLRGGEIDENSCPYSQSFHTGAAAPSAKKKQKVPKIYKPQFRTANYTFLCVLFKHQRLNLNYPMSKQQLMDAAELSGISRAPIKGQSGVVGPSRPGAKQQFEYNGWNGFRDLANKEPPYVLAYSNPVKIKLTPEGERLAADFFKEMVTMEYIPDLPGNLSVMNDSEPWSQPSSTPHPMPSSQSFRNASQPTHSPHSASQQYRTSASLASSHRPTGNISRLHSQGSQDSPRASWHPSSSMHGAGQPQGIAGGRSGGSHPTSNPLLPNPSSCLRAAMESRQPSSANNSQHAQPSNATGHEHGGSVRNTGQRQSAKSAAAAHNPLLPHPSACLRKAQEELQPSRLSADAAEVAASQSAAAARAAASKPADARQPLTVRQVSRDDPLVLSLMEVLECSFAKAQQALQGGASTVEEAMERYFELPDGPDETEEDGYGETNEYGDDMAYAGSLQHDMCHHDDVPFEIPMGASQSNCPSVGIHTTTTAGPAPATTRPSVTLPPSLTAPASAVPGRTGATAASSGAAGSARANGKAASRPQPLAREVPSLSHQPVRGSHVAGMDSQGSGQSGLTGPSNSQAQTSSGHIQAATLESSKANWQLSALGIGGQVEEQDVRLPPLPPGRPFNDCYELVLIIDSREKFAGNDRNNGLTMHLQPLIAKGVAAEVRTLQHGDVLWVARSRQNPAVEYVLDYILERKNVEDLYGSIKTIRYESQKYGMRRCGLRHLMYLVEGDPNNLQDSAIQAVKTASHQTEVVGGYTVLRTNKPRDTLRCLGDWTNALIRKYSHLTASHPQVQRDGDSLPTFSEFKAVTLENKSRTVQDVWGLILTSLPGWSNIMAEAVVKQYGTPLLLYKAYQQVMMTAAQQGRSPLEAARQLLMTCDLASNRRPVSLNNSAKVFDMLFGNGWHVV